MIHMGQHKRCGLAILSRNLISQLSKIREIRENKVTQKFPSIQYSGIHLLSSEDAIVRLIMTINND